MCQLSTFMFTNYGLPTNILLLMVIKAEILDRHWFFGVVTSLNHFVNGTCSLNIFLVDA